MNAPVSFIGSGNLAWHLAPALDNAGYTVREVYSRNPRNAELLVERLYEADVKATLDFSTSVSKYFILAVSDEALEEVVREIILPEEATLIHTSGAHPLSRLGYAATSNIAVLYPLQVFTKASKIDFSDVPLFIETEIREVEGEVLKLSRAISKQVLPVTAQQRKALQVAAVMAAGFTNHMLRMAKKICEEKTLDFNLLSPIIAETLNNSLSMGPEGMQVGPAYTGDFQTLDKHMEFLQHDERLAEVYRVISQHIIDEHAE
jgi:predicted short-subunit dehydrogenase-like oxidoreductase (DUF2520 family)